ncbi:MAG TPA: hypothetical protein VF838_06710 [Trebonia sp.]
MTPDERDEISVSVAAHHELGPDYDKAVAEGLVERIGEEIDKRVDTRLRTAAAQAPPATVPARRHPGFPVVLVSLIFGTGATSVVLGNETTNSAAQTVMVLLIWVAIAVINVVYALRR